MLIAKINFYFESAKKTGEKFREKLGFQNHCPHPYYPPNRYQDNRVGGKRSSFLPTFIFRPLTPPYMRFRIRRFLF